MEKGSLTKLLNGVLLKKYPCINTIYVSYNDLKIKDVIIIFINVSEDNSYYSLFYPNKITI